jgi:hypothetical protein
VVVSVAFGVAMLFLVALPIPPRRRLGDDLVRVAIGAVLMLVLLIGSSWARRRK